MSRIKMWKDVVDDIRTLADSLETLVNAMESGEEDKVSEKPEVKPAETKAEEKKPEKKISLEEVRKVLTEKSGAGHTAQVKALLVKHGGNKLSDIPEEEYEGLLNDVKEIE